MNCPKCTQVLRPEARFCDGCGSPVTSRGAADSVAQTLRDDPLVGQTLDGKYELLARLGAGAMGTVYRARRVHIGDEVAVKVLPRSFVADAASGERFRREARAAAMLRHPNVVAIYDYGEAKSDDAPAYIVMELVEGRSLRGLLQREDRLTPARAVALMQDICRGVGAAHRRGVFHRDLKPDNVVVLPPDEDREAETVKVVDFGIAKLRDAAGAPTLTTTGAVVGTPHYMSPEQCRGEPLDARSDVYSLGAMLYEMLAGAPPFMAESVTGVIAKHLFDPPPLAPELGVAPHIESVILRALAKDPAGRQPDAAAFARELQEAERRAREQTPRATDEEQRRRDSAAQRVSAEQTARERSGAGQNGRIGLEAGAEERAMREADTRRHEPRPHAPPPAPQAVKREAGGRRVMLFAALSLMSVALVAAALLTASRNLKNVRTNVDDKDEPAQTADGGDVSRPDEKPPGPAGGAAPPPGMVYVPGGEFMMGRVGGDLSERPAHRVSVGPFFIAVHEVTNEEYARFVRAKGYRAPPSWKGGTYPAGVARAPVTGVDWHDANAYAAWAGMRLPTEEEWEFAARGADGRRYPWGDEWRDGLANANRVSMEMAEVGSYKGASPFGVFDMVGNAWEWTASEMKAYPGGRLPTGLPKGDLKVIRGGGYESTKDYATVTYRSGWPARGAKTYDQTGFRCAKDAK